MRMQYVSHWQILKATFDHELNSLPNLRGLAARGLRLFEGFVAANERRIDNQLDTRDRVVGRSTHAQILRLGETEMCLRGTHACMCFV
jgi:hypothetical protein